MKIKANFRPVDVAVVNTIFKTFAMTSLTMKKVKILSKDMNLNLKDNLIYD